MATDPSDRPTDEHDRPPATLPGAPMPGPESSLWLRPQPTPTSWPQPPAPPSSYLGAPQYPPAAYPYRYHYPGAWAPPEPENGQAIAALVLGIVGLFFLLTGVGFLFFINLPCSILAWIFGVKAKNRVDRGETTKNRGMAQAGLITGIIGTALGVLAIVFWILVVVAAALEGQS